MSEIRSKKYFDIHELQMDDKIVFYIGGIEFVYTIENHNKRKTIFLFNETHRAENWKIFEELGVRSSELREGFCSYFYGYKAFSGGFPECKVGDLDALTRVIVGLYDAIDAYNFGIKIEEK